MKLLVVNGPNLNLLGTRETQIYGNVTFEAYLEQLKSQTTHELLYFQSNVEGELINCLQESDADGIILNAGGYTHTSVALRDCSRYLNSSGRSTYLQHRGPRKFQA